MNKKLNIGVLVDDYLLPAWKYKILEEISTSDFALISLIIKNGRMNNTASKIGGNGSIVFRMHKKLDCLAFSGKNSYSLQKNIKELLKDIPVLQVIALKNENSEGFSQEALAGIRKYHPDILLKLGFGLLSGEILRIPQYGVWSYSMDKYDTEKDGTAGYYEVVTGNPVTGSELVILNDNGRGNKIISNVWESTCSYSIHLNRDKLFWRASLFTPRVIEGISRYGNEFLENLERKYEKGNTDGVVQLPALSFLSATRNFWNSLINLVRKSIKKIIYSDPFSWILLFRINGGNNFLQNSYRSFIKLQPPKDKFWADPFVIEKDGRFYIFVEEYIYRKNKGHISVLEIDGSGNLINVQKIIEKVYHMSYPFIIETGGDYFMIPETGGNRTIDLYKCTEFPGRWEFVKTIMSDVNAVDSTLFYYDGKWWLFTVIDKINNFPDGSPELYLYYSNDMLSDNWISHPCNPVVTDVRTARPAGKIFIHDGKIYRPSQDCAGRYGKAFNINRIVTLTEKYYEEVKVIKVEPDWDRKLKGTHTLNFDKGFTVIDAYSFRKRRILN